MEVENKMFADECWPVNEPEYIGQCENCLQDILDGDDYIKLSNGMLYCCECYERHL